MAHEGLADEGPLREPAGSMASSLSPQDYPVEQIFPDILEVTPLEFLERLAQVMATKAEDVAIPKPARRPTLPQRPLQPQSQPKRDCPKAGNFETACGGKLQLHPSTCQDCTPVPCRLL